MGKDANGCWQNTMNKCNKKKIDIGKKYALSVDLD